MSIHGGEKYIHEKKNPSKKHVDRLFVTELNVNTYYVTANIDPLQHVNMMDYSAYFILRDR